MKGQRARLPLEGRPNCLGCGRPFVRRREAHISIGGRRDGSLLTVFDVEPLLIRATDVDALIGAEDLYLLGVAHRACEQLALGRLAAGEVDVPGDLIMLRVSPDESVLPALHLPPPLDRCPFCNGPVETDDHVFAEWISDLFAAAGGKLTDRGAEHGPRRLLKIDRIAPCCEECNNEWLSVLENDASKILKPMILGQDHRRLEPAEQRLLATWAVKTAILMDLTSGTPTVPAAFFHMLRQRREPLKSTIVDIGAYMDPTWAVWSKLMPLHVDIPETELPNAIVVTMLIGRVIFQVIVAHGVLAISDDRVYRDALARIWPQRAVAIDWPANRLAFTDEWLDLLAGNFTLGASEKPEK